MAVTIADVRNRWNVQGDASTDVTDAVLTILLNEASTTLAGAAFQWGAQYDTALTHLTAHFAFERVQASQTDTATYGRAQSESFVQRSISRGGASSVPAAWMRFSTTIPGAAFIQLAMARDNGRMPMVSSG